METYEEAKFEAAWETLEKLAYDREAEHQAKHKVETIKTGRPNVSHYVQGIESIDYIQSHNMNFSLGNAIKYVTRCNYKGTKREDLLKAIDYINFELEDMDE